MHKQRQSRFCIVAGDIFIAKPFQRIVVIRKMLYSPLQGLNSAVKRSLFETLDALLVRFLRTFGHILMKHYCV